MSYTSIDPITTAWAARHGLHVQTRYRDDEVRSVDVVGHSGRRCQIWIDPPDQAGKVGVHIWDFKSKKLDKLVCQDDLSACLDDVYTTALGWVT